MTLASEIITEAYRENNLIAIGETPTDAERAEALPRLNNIVDSLFGTTIGQWLLDWETPPKRNTNTDRRWPLSAASTELPTSVWPYPPYNARLIANLTGPTTIYLYPQPEDGALMEVANAGDDFSTHALTINANGRDIEAADQVVLNGTGRTFKWFYRADLAQWIRIQPLTEASEMPLPPQFDDYFIAALNIRLSARMARQPLPQTVELMMDAKTKMKRRYTQNMAAEWQPAGRFFRTYQSYANARQGAYGGSVSPLIRS